MKRYTQPILLRPSYDRDEYVDRDSFWIDRIYKDDLIKLRAFAIVQLVCGFLLFCLWIWKRNKKQIGHEVTTEAVPVGERTQTVIGQEGDQVVGVQRVNTIYAIQQNIREVITYKKRSCIYALIPVYILLSGAFGILSLYFDVSELDEDPVWLFRIFQVFICLNLIILIPVAAVCAVAFCALDLKEFFLFLAFCALLFSIQLAVLAYGWEWSFGLEQLY